jgi:Tfp pilus assembly protein PilF
MDPTSSTNTQQLLGDAITQLRNDQPATARDLAHRAVDLGLDDATVWGVIALASRNMADYDAAQQAADRAIAHQPNNSRAFTRKTILVQPRPTTDTHWR